MIVKGYEIKPCADLTFADLRGANLTHADLEGATLYGATLTHASLTRANLVGADLAHADLAHANLRNADLTEANLTNTWLTHTNLTDANLTGTCLDPKAPVPALTDEEILEAGLEIESELVYGWRTERSQHRGDTVYEPGQCYETPWFSVCQETDCHPGIYLASERWLRVHYSPPLVRCYCRRDELVHAGDKWRCKRLWVVAS